MTTYDKSTVINPDTVQVGDRVIPQNYQNCGLPYALKDLKTCTVTQIDDRSVGGITVRIKEAPGTDYGYEWFRPDPTQYESYLFVDSSKIITHWVYSPENDWWNCFDHNGEVGPDFALTSGYRGFDRGIEDMIQDFGLADVSEGYDQPEPLVGGEPVLASLPHETARRYAEDSRSRKLLTEEQDLLLYLASRGEEVDVYEFRKAATAALSAATTRAGQSMGRREYAKKARHLIYWADAIIDNHRNGLPTYESGQRSAKIAQLEKDLRSANNEIAILIGDKGGLENEVLKLQEAARVAQDVADDMGKIADESAAKLQETLRDLGEAIQERQRWADTVAYAVEQDRTFGQRLLGYYDGLLNSEPGPR